MGGVADEEVLRRFVLRARRIEAHSLVQDPAELHRWAEGRIEATLDITGRVAITQRLPLDEEVFESLAARIRPLTVRSEPVHYERVFRAIERLAQLEAGDAAFGQMSDLLLAWRAAEIQGTAAQGYAVQRAQLDGSEATPLVSDTQLAAAWLYADLVHADAQGAKQAALAFSLRERYSAAVRLFSHLALLTVATRRLVEGLCAQGAISVPESVLLEDVVVGDPVSVTEVDAFVAPVGSTFPDLREGTEFGDEWSPLTLTEMLRLDPTNQVRVVLVGDDASTIATYDAAATRRRTEGELAWEVLVAGCARFRFAFDLDDGRPARVRPLGCDLFDSTNELKLAATNLQLQLHRATAVKFLVGDDQILSLAPPAASPEVLVELQVIAETVSDIVIIERLSGSTTGPCLAAFGDRERVLLRTARLAWEGSIVRGTRHPLAVASPHGGPPQVVEIAAGAVDVGGAKVPTPMLLMRHPSMRVERFGPLTDRDAFLVVPPTGSRLSVWSPDHAQVASDDQLLTVQPWGLMGIDERGFDF